MSFQPLLRPDALRRTLGNFVNVNATSLYTIWESQPYRELQANYYGESPVPGLQYTPPGCNISGGPARSLMTGATRKDEPERASPAGIARRNAAVTEAYQAAEQHRRPGGGADALRAR